ncbi:MAG: hypothetical protein ACRD18_07460 [Terriglobia bacterium]
MKILGLVLAVCGWLIPVACLSLAPSTSVRLIVTLGGIALCLIGIFLFLNRAYVRQAVWKK